MFFWTGHIAPPKPVSPQVLRRAYTLSAVIFGCLSLGHLACADSLVPELQRTAVAATFEVVLPKPAKESLTYDRPWQDLLPFKIRSDKYVPIGTAFSVGEGRYVTAMHVLLATLGDSRGEPLLRDANGHVYAIEQILKGSVEKDFALFTLATRPASEAALEIEEHPQINEAVYAVGNALGEGIVAREGNYVSNTPEDENGRWQWLRFSAPISGGNSGGPLLNARGKVIGIVRAKRSSENTLNFAVPIALAMKGPDALVEADTRTVSTFAVFDKSKVSQFKLDIPAPKTFSDFAAAYMKAAGGFGSRQLQDLIAENENETFPHGDGSMRILHSSYERPLPGIVTQSGNGVWTIEQPRYAQTDFGDGGWQESGTFKGYTFYYRRKPDRVTSSSWYSDPVLPKELALKSAPGTIHIDAQNVRILSLGKPESDTLYTDAWGRIWQTRLWRVNSSFVNGWAIEFDLPVPGGYVGFQGELSNIGRDEQIDRMKLLTEFVVTSYDGTLEQWNDFLSRTALLPKTLAGTTLHADYGHSFAFNDMLVAFSYDAELQKISADSRVRIDFGFVADGGGHVTLRPSGVDAYNKDDQTDVGVFRHVSPEKASSAEAFNEWDKRVRHGHPYDAIAVLSNGRQSISTTLAAGDVNVDSRVVFTFRYRAGGGVPQEIMKAKLDLLTKAAKVADTAM